MTSPLLASPPLARPLAFAASLLLSLACSSAQAADLWLDPLNDRPQAQGRVGVRTLFGGASSSRAVPRQPARTEGLWVRGPRGLVRLPGQAGDDPIGLLELQGDGLHVVGFRGAPAFGRLGAAGFERLLVESGAVVEVRKLPSGPIVRVLFRRSAKALLYAGAGGGPSDHARPLGLDLELTPLGDPHALASDAQGALAPLSLRLTWGGRPVAGAQVRAHDQQGKELAPQRTDAKGVVSLRLPKRGRWVLSATALRESSDLAPWRVGFTTLIFNTDLKPPERGPAVLSDVLRRGSRRSALRPLLGRHHFTFTRRHFDAQGMEVAATPMLMTYELTLDPKRRLFGVAVDVSPQQRAHGIVFRYEVGYDGRLRSLTNGDGEATLKGTQLHLPSGAKPSVDPALVLPKVVGVFAIPMLAERARRLRLVDVTPFATLSRPLTFERVEPGHADHDAEHATWITHEGRPTWTTRVRVPHKGPFAGRLVEIQTRSEVDARGQVRTLNDCRRLTAEAFVKRWTEWYGAPPDFAKGK